ncbi:MAG: tyrosine-type recombinase/integrase [Actinomycetota bacterium]
MRFHDLRHTYASLLIAQGENLKFIQQQLGHSSAQVTLDRYGHLMPQVQQGAGERLQNSVFGNFAGKMREKANKDEIDQSPTGVSSHLELRKEWCPRTDSNGRPTA